MHLFHEYKLNTDRLIVSINANRSCFDTFILLFLLLLMCPLKDKKLSYTFETFFMEVEVLPDFFKIKLKEKNPIQALKENNLRE